MSAVKSHAMPSRPIRQSYDKELRLAPLNDIRLTHVWDVLTQPYDGVTDAPYGDPENAVITVDSTTECDTPQDVKELGIGEINKVELTYSDYRMTGSPSVYVTISRRHRSTVVQTWSTDALVRQRAEDVTNVLRGYQVSSRASQFARWVPVLAFATLGAILYFLIYRTWYSSVLGAVAGVAVGNWVGIKLGLKATPPAYTEKAQPAPYARGSFIVAAATLAVSVVGVVITLLLTLT